MRVSVGNSTAVLRCNTANLSLTIGGKFEIMNKRIGSVQIENEVFQSPVQHLAKPLTQTKNHPKTLLLLQIPYRKLF